MRIYNLFILFFIIEHTVQAQDWELEKRHNISNKVTSIDSDNKGTLYVGTNLGKVFQFDSKLNLKTTFSLVNNSSVTYISAWNPLRIFIFYRENQQFSFIERFNSNPVIYDISYPTASYIMNMVPSQDHSFWAIETGNFNLIKLNETTIQVLLSIPVSTQTTVEQPIKMETYNGNVFILSETGDLYIYDRFGNEINKLLGGNMIDFNLFQNKLYYITQHQLISVPFNELNNSKSVEIDLPEKKYKMFEVLQKGIFLFCSESQLDIYNYKLR
jgi:hypothetical protein